MEEIAERLFAVAGQKSLSISVEKREEKDQGPQTDWNRVLILKSEQKVLSKTFIEQSIIMIGEIPYPIFRIKETEGVPGLGKEGLVIGALIVDFLIVNLSSTLTPEMEKFLETSKVGGPLHNSLITVTEDISKRLNGTALDITYIEEMYCLNPSTFLAGINALKLFGFTVQLNSFTAD